MTNPRDGTSECVFSLKLSLLHAVLRNVHPDDVLFLTVPSDPGQALHFVRIADVFPLGVCVASQNGGQNSIANCHSIPICSAANQAFERPDSLAHRSEYTVRQTVILSDHPHLSMEQIETRFIVEILLPSEFFSEIMNDLRTVSPELRIVVCEREVLFCAANEQISTTVSISKAEVDIVLHRDRLGGPLARPDIGAPPQEASLPPAGEPRILMEKCFLLRYLAAISRCHKASSDLILQLGEKTPISLFFALRNFGTIRFFVAPVFSDDDDNEDTRSDDEGIGDGAQHATAGDQTFQERVLAGNLQTPNETRMTELRAADLSVSLPPAP